MNGKNEKLSVTFVMIAMLFCVCLVISNFLETKLFHVYGSLNLTCGFLIFPITYILNDCIAEVWGYAKARFVIWIAFILDFIAVALCGASCLLPPVEDGADAAFCEVFAFAPQVAVASFVAFIIGSFLNAWVMSVMKIAHRDNGRKDYYFSLRAIASTRVGESADSLVFFPLAFYLLPMLFEGQPKVSAWLLVDLMLTQVAAKTLYEVLVLPLTIRLVKRLKCSEGIETYDDNVSYNPLKITQI